MVACLLVALAALVQGCNKQILISSGTHTLVEKDGALVSAPIVTVLYPDWSNLEPSVWVWGEDGQVLGTYIFHDKFVVPQWVLDSGASVILYISVDNYHEGRINGVVYAPFWSDTWYIISRYDLTPNVLGSSETLGLHENQLLFTVNNWFTWGGIVYTVKIEY